MYIFDMESTVLISGLAADAAGVVKRAEKEGLVPIARHGRTVAFLIGREKLAGLLETMELQKDPKLMELVRAHRAGKLALQDLE
jgi:PHD/YefM family antitoxin component YafN of YafNO toxin-antitoxin module